MPHSEGSELFHSSTHCCLFQTQREAVERLPVDRGLHFHHLRFANHPVLRLHNQPLPAAHTDEGTNTWRCARQLLDSLLGSLLLEQLLLHAKCYPC